MATLYITEYAAMAATGNGIGVPIPQSPALATQVVAISGTHAESATFNSGTRFIRVHTDAICSIAIDVTPVAAATSTRLPADATEYFGVVGGAHKLSVISNT